MARMHLKGIMALVFIILDRIFVSMSTTTMIPGRGGPLSLEKNFGDDAEFHFICSPYDIVCFVDQFI